MNSVNADGRANQENIGPSLPLKNMLLTGIAYTGLEAKALDIVDSIHPADELQISAFKLGKLLATKDRAIYTSIRNDMRPQIQTLLNELK